MTEHADFSATPRLPPIQPVQPVKAIDATTLARLVQASRQEPFRRDDVRLRDNEAFQAFDPRVLPRSDMPLTPAAEADPDHGTDLADRAEGSGDAADGDSADQLTEGQHVDPAPSQPGTTAETPAEVRAAAYAEGYEAGLAEGAAQGVARGRAEAEGQLAGALRTLETALARLAQPKPEDTARLAASIAGAVRALAIQRAGQLIDAAPLPFMARIEALADRVSQGVRQVTLLLNPADLAALTPHLAGSDILQNALVKGDPRLARGDVDIRAPGVRLADLLAAPDSFADVA